MMFSGFDSYGESYRTRQRDASIRLHPTVS